MKRSLRNLNENHLRGVVFLALLVCIYYIYVSITMLAVHYIADAANDGTAFDMIAIAAILLLAVAYLVFSINYLCIAFLAILPEKGKTWMHNMVSRGTIRPRVMWPTKYLYAMALDK